MEYLQQSNHVESRRKHKFQMLYSSLEEEFRRLEMMAHQVLVISPQVTAVMALTEATITQP